MRCNPCIGVSSFRYHIFQKFWNLILSALGLIPFFRQAGGCEKNTHLTYLKILEVSELRVCCSRLPVPRPPLNFLTIFFGFQRPNAVCRYVRIMTFRTIIGPFSKCCLRVSVDPFVPLLPTPFSIQLSALAHTICWPYLFPLGICSLTLYHRKLVASSNLLILFPHITVYPFIIFYKNNKPINRYGTSLRFVSHDHHGAASSRCTMPDALSGAKYESVGECTGAFILVSARAAALENRMPASFRRHPLFSPRVFPSPSRIFAMNVSTLGFPPCHIPVARCNKLVIPLL